MMHGTINIKYFLFIVICIFFCFQDLMFQMLTEKILLYYKPVRVQYNKTLKIHFRNYAYSRYFRYMQSLSGFLLVLLSPPMIVS